MLERVNVHDMISKFSSKKEVHTFLCQECEAYLPKVDTVNIFFLKLITRGEKNVSISVNPGVVY
jgi:hypothetical protein